MRRVLAVGILARRVAKGRRRRRIYSIVSPLLLAAAFGYPASGQDRQLPDFTTVPTRPIADVSDDVREIVFTAVCHLPDTVRDPERGEDSLLPLVVFADTVAFELTEYEPCHDRMDLSAIRRMEFLRGFQAVRMYGDRASGGALRVFPKKPAGVRSTRTRILSHG